MKSEYINPFYTASKEVIRKFIPGIEINRGELSLEPTPAKTLGATIFIGISGQLQGRVIFDMDQETAVEVASAMNDEELCELNKMVRSTIQEMANIISGNAATKLNDNLGNEQIDLTPPSMILGAETEIDDSRTDNFLKIPLETSYGPIEISIAVERI